MNTFDLTGFVLAGGKSKRMGRDKALLDWHGQSLVDHMAGLLRTVANPVHVVGRDPLPDIAPGLGPLSGIVTGLQASLSDANLFVAVDLPLLTQDFLKYLRNRLKNSNRPLLACRIGSGFPLCVGVSRSMLLEIQQRLADNRLSVHGLIEANQADIVSEAQIVAAGSDLSIFHNINSPEDYLAALGG